MPNKDFDAWRQARYDELAAPDSWLGLVGLFWLVPGINSVGSAPDATVNLPIGPARLGDLRWEGGRVFWQRDGTPSIELQTDRDGKPSSVDYENYTFFIVDRDNRLAVRLRDRDWSTRQPFAGLDYFDFDPAWQIKAQWQPLVPPVMMEVPNISGDLKTVEVAYQALFELAGQTVRLLPMSVGDNEIFFVFRDRSSGRETYGAGRFLKVPAPTMETTAGPRTIETTAGPRTIETTAGPRTIETKAGPGVDGEITLDFNRAYNPPCAFTPFATCPLPPPENWLPFAVTAGEKSPLK